MRRVCGRWSVGRRRICWSAQGGARARLPHGLVCRRLLPATLKWISGATCWLPAWSLMQLLAGVPAGYIVRCKPRPYGLPGGRVTAAAISLPG